MRVGIYWESNYRFYLGGDNQWHIAHQQTLEAPACGEILYALDEFLRVDSASLCPICSRHFANLLFMAQQENN